MARKKDDSNIEEIDLSSLMLDDEDLAELMDLDIIPASKPIIEEKKIEKDSPKKEKGEKPSKEILE